MPPKRRAFCRPRYGLAVVFIVVSCGGSDNGGTSTGNEAVITDPTGQAAPSGRGLPRWDPPDQGGLQPPSIASTLACTSGVPMGPFAARSVVFSGGQLLIASDNSSGGVGASISATGNWRTAPDEGDSGATLWTAPINAAGTLTMQLTIEGNGILSGAKVDGSARIGNAPEPILDAVQCGKLRRGIPLEPFYPIAEQSFGWNDKAINVNCSSRTLTTAGDTINDTFDASLTLTARGGAELVLPRFTVNFDPALDFANRGTTPQGTYSMQRTLEGLTATLVSPGGQMLRSIAIDPGYRFRQVTALFTDTTPPAGTTELVCN